MFRLHDRTRRRLCIAGFFALCVLPTALVLLWAAARHLPGVAAAEAERLGSRLGVAVAIDRVEFPRPGATRYVGFRAADPETGQLLLRCREVEVRAGAAADSEGNRHGLVSVHLTAAELSRAAAPRLMALVDQATRSDRAPGASNLRVTSQQIVVEGGSERLTLAELDGRLEHLGGGVQAQLLLRLAAPDPAAGPDAPGATRVRYVRNRQSSPPLSGFELDTGGTDVPCELLAMALPEFGPLAPDGRFRGYLWASQTADPSGGTEWGGELIGQFERVDLERLMAGRIPHHISGSAQVHVHSGRFRGERIERAAAIVTAGPGTIGRSLADSLRDHLGVLSNLAPGGAGGPAEAGFVPYGQLCIAVMLDAQGARLQGRCPAETPGVLLADHRQWLLAEPSGSLPPQPVSALIRALAPGGTGLIPARDEAAWLARHLPLEATSASAAVSTRPVSPATAPMR